MVIKSQCLLIVKMYWDVLVSYLKSTTKLSFELDYCTMNMVSGEQLSADHKVSYCKIWNF